MDSLFTFCRTRPSTKGNDSGSGTNPPAQYQSRSLSRLSLPRLSPRDLQAWWLPRRSVCVWARLRVAESCWPGSCHLCSASEGGAPKTLSSSLTTPGISHLHSVSFTVFHCGLSYDMDNKNSFTFHLCMWVLLDHCVKTSDQGDWMGFQTEPALTPATGWRLGLS